jgi:hypothetical protein
MLKALLVLSLSAAATVEPGETFTVWLSVYGDTPHTVTLSVTGGELLDSPVWLAPTAPGYPQIRAFRVKAGDGEKVVVRAGSAAAVVNIRKPQVGACGQIGCYYSYLPVVSTTAR